MPVRIMSHETVNAGMASFMKSSFISRMKCSIGSDLIQLRASRKSKITRVTTSAVNKLAVIGAGIVPAGLEMMDRPATHAVEQFVRAGYDLEAAVILLCESDGTPEEVEEEIARMTEVLRGAGAYDFRVSRNEAERLKFW